LKTLKVFLALGLVTVCFAGCSKSANNGNTTTTTSTNIGNTKSTSSPATTTNSADSKMNAPTSTTGAGETFTNAEAGVQMTLPAGWKSKNEGETITVGPADDLINVVLWVPKDDDFEKAVNDLAEELDKVIKNSKITQPGQETTHNGMQAYTAGGTGEVDGKEIVWSVDMLKAKKPFIVLTFAAPQQSEEHANEYKQFSASLKQVE
jgi:predicted Zn-dependent protease